MNPTIYYIGHDNSGHDYLVPWMKREEFSKWSELPEDDEAGWTAPDWAFRIDGGCLTFENPVTREWNDETITE